MALEFVNCSSSGEIVISTRFYPLFTEWETINEHSKQSSAMLQRETGKQNTSQELSIREEADRAVGEAQRLHSFWQAGRDAGARLLRAVSTAPAGVQAEKRQNPRLQAATWLQGTVSEPGCVWWCQISSLAKASLFSVLATRKEKLARDLTALRSSHQHWLEASLKLAELLFSIVYLLFLKLKIMPTKNIDHFWGLFETC